MNIKLGMQMFLKKIHEYLGLDSLNRREKKTYRIWY